MIIITSIRVIFQEMITVVLMPAIVRLLMATVNAYGMQFAFDPEFGRIPKQPDPSVPVTIDVLVPFVGQC